MSDWAYRMTGDLKLNGRLSKSDSRNELEIGLLYSLEDRGSEWH
jgi:hypothetical protein